ncbi:MAG: hypothetical protein ACLRZ9_10890 [Eubacterium sp.]
MLGKLIKNEFKATSRNFIPVYIIMIVVTIFFKITMEIQESAGIESKLLDILGGLLMITYIIALIAVIIGTIILIIKRFYDNMLKDEGYLSFTLPVSTGQHLASKTIVSYVWMLVSIILVIAAVMVIPLGHGIYSEIFKELGVIIDGITEMGWWHYVVEVALMCIVSIYSYIMMGYTCFSVGQNFNKHRIVGAFITYIVIYVISQVLNSVVMVYLMGVDLNDEISVMSNVFHPLMIYSLVLAIIESVVFTVITYVMLNKKLNLE